MTFEEIIALPIKDIREDTFKDGSVYIWFEIENHTFFVHANSYTQTQNNLIVSSITHDKKEKKCPVCLQKDKRMCQVLNQYLADFFQWLIEQKPLRLHWLYRDYTTV